MADDHTQMLRNTQRLIDARIRKLQAKHVANIVESVRLTDERRILQNRIAQLQVIRDDIAGALKTAEAPAPTTITAPAAGRMQ